MEEAFRLLGWQVDSVFRHLQPAALVCGSPLVKLLHVQSVAAVKPVPAAPANHAVNTKLADMHFLDSFGRDGTLMLRGSPSGTLSRPSSEFLSTDADSTYSCDPAPAAVSLVLHSYAFDVTAPFVSVHVCSAGIERLRAKPGKYIASHKSCPKSERPFSFMLNVSDGAISAAASNSETQRRWTLTATTARCSVVDHTQPIPSSPGVVLASGANEGKLAEPSHSATVLETLPSSVSKHLFRLGRTTHCQRLLLKRAFVAWFQVFKVWL
jgi:hypothetical protein